ncbi:aldo/keto reductase [Sinomonas atrocyanea]|uniref:aldo/keto reductase n=1 Tax=Sinomonas atrocyanea TaxID=37927 RepID=UPI0028581F50|nr:aldo/keto reductase [Sinomonas atrocyanea]MDR6623507.1 aryl-alcohol dehydrogenase-like predicted oxidoreductase [Sinomonas atrocyanea]
MTTPHQTRATSSPDPRPAATAVALLLAAAVAGGFIRQSTTPDGPHSHSRTGPRKGTTLHKRPLGRTGLEVSPIAIGGAAFTYVHETTGWNPLTEEGAAVVLDTLNACLDQGINYIDTAQAYGDGYSETLIGRVMKHRREDCVLASKAWFHLDAAGIEESVHDSLRRLQTDHLDILQIHGRMFTPEDVDHVLTGGPLKALVKLREQGKIGHIGITTDEPYTVISFLEHEDIEVYQIAYNLIYQGAARHFLPQAAEAGVGIVTMRTMTSGIFQREAGFLAPGWETAHSLYDAALKFVLSDSRIHSGIVGMRWPQEVRENVRIVEGFQPKADFAEMPRVTFGVYKAEDEGAPNGAGL